MTPSYEVIKWIPFETEQPPANTPLILWGEGPGIHLAHIIDGAVSPPTFGYFSHWAKRPSGVTGAQKWMDWFISWIK